VWHRDSSIPAEKYATFAKMYKTVTINSEIKPLRLSCFTGFWDAYVSVLLHLTPHNRTWDESTPYLHLVDNIKGILITSIREDDLDQGVRKPVGCGVAFERVPKVGLRICHSCIAAKNNQPGDGDENQCQNLDDTDGV
jgi:hypothetical protein